MTTVIYSIWASGEVQPFNDPKTSNAPELGNAMDNNNVSVKNQNFEQNEKAKRME